MNILLDTHIVIWAINNDRKLSEKARDIILDAENDLYYSVASVVEVDMKIKSKKNNLTFTLDQFIQKCKVSGFIPAPLKEEYIIEANRLVWDGDGDHKDPFDRVLLAQAMIEGMSFMTHDDKIPKFRQQCVIEV